MRRVEGRHPKSLSWLCCYFRDTNGPWHEERIVIETHSSVTMTVFHSKRYLYWPFDAPQIWGVGTVVVPLIKAKRLRCIEWAPCHSQSGGPRAGGCQWGLPEKHFLKHGSYICSGGDLLVKKQFWVAIQSKSSATLIVIWQSSISVKIK